MGVLEPRRKTPPQARSVLWRQCSAATGTAEAPMGQCRARGLGFLSFLKYLQFLQPLRGQLVGCYLVSEELLSLGFVVVVQLFELFMSAKVRLVYSAD